MWAPKLSFIAAIIVIAILPFFPFSPTQTLNIGDRSYLLNVANTNTEREKGLAGITLLPANQGMLFVFNQPGVECFWMKDTLIPLDMIWINQTKQVKFIKADVSPSSYPEAFCPPVTVSYVIELNAGVAQTAGIKVGETLQF